MSPAHSELNPDTVTHFSTNRARRSVTSLMCATLLPQKQMSGGFVCRHETWTLVVTLLLLLSFVDAWWERTTPRRRLKTIMYAYSAVQHDVSRVHKLFWLSHVNLHVVVIKIIIIILYYGITVVPQTRTSSAAMSFRRRSDVTGAYRCSSTTQPSKANSAFHPSGVGKWVAASAGMAKAGMVHSIMADERGVCR